VVTIDNFPKSVNFDLEPKETFGTGAHFLYHFTTPDMSAPNWYDQKDIAIRGFNGEYDIKKINIAGEGLVGGLVIDEIVDGLILNGALVDITQPIAMNIGSNTKWRNNYSTVDLGLKSYAETENGLDLNIFLGSVTRDDSGFAGLIGGILGGDPGLLGLGGLLNTILGLIITPLETIPVSINLKLPLLNGTNLSVEGNWDQQSQQVDHESPDHP
ncbi:MAG: hypothetical protein LBU92_02785, partial [Prevotellaceae bacterium]|nr:hypothetical protein [Prevotellaceae bacterium]